MTHLGTVTRFVTEFPGRGDLAAVAAATAHPQTMAPAPTPAAPE